MKKLLVAFALVSAACAAFAGANPVGAWKGKIDLKIDMSKFKDPSMKATVQKQVENSKKTTMALNVAANNTFSMTVKGVDMTGAAKTSTVVGKWVVKGDKFTLKPEKVNGKALTAEQKAMQDKQPNTFTMGKNGSTMSVDLPMSGMGSGKLTFTKG